MKMGNSFNWCVSYICDNYGEEQIVTLFDNEEAAEKMQKLLDMLDDNDDVQNVYHNWDMPEEPDED